MRKFIILVMFLLPLFACGAVEIQPDAPPAYEVKYKRRKKAPEKAVMTNINKIFCGSLLAEYSILTLGSCISSAVFTHATDYVFAPVLLGLATGGLFLSGISMIAAGNYGYRKTFVCTDDLLKRFNQRISILETCAIISGFACGFGVLLAGGGIAVLASNFNLMNKEELTVTGGIMTGIGGGFSLLSLPIMITSLAMSAWLKGQTNRLSVDIGVTSGKSGELSCDKKRNALEKPSGVKLAMSVKF
ncbi:MAG: hypothetical protein UHW86_11835 [Spirochaetota bacterium]|nr:hypothetical protein [Spirochaetota bacterium]